MKFIGIIPARYASTRFPAKPLAMLGGRPVIQRVYEQVNGILDDACVATDDERIEAAVKAFGGKVVMTSTEHKSGTDRVQEAFEKVGAGYDVVVNIQGDEPFIQPSQITALMDCFSDADTEIATLVHPFTSQNTWDDLANPNYVKVVVAADRNTSFLGKAVYFSRSVVPYLRGVEQSEWLRKGQFYRHIGMYAYRADVLQRITQLRQTPLELAECLEQLRWLEHGLTIKVAECHTVSIGIDTPQDLEKAIEYLQTEQ